MLIIYPQLVGSCTSLSTSRARGEGWWNVALRIEPSVVSGKGWPQVQGHGPLFFKKWSLSSTTEPLMWKWVLPAYWGGKSLMAVERKGCRGGHGGGGVVCYVTNFSSDSSSSVWESDKQTHSEPPTLALSLPSSSYFLCFAFLQLKHVFWFSFQIYATDFPTFPLTFFLFLPYPPSPSPHPFLIHILVPVCRLPSSHTFLQTMRFPVTFCTTARWHLIELKEIIPSNGEVLGSRFESDTESFKEVFMLTCHISVSVWPGLCCVLLQLFL